MLQIWDTLTQPWKRFSDGDLLCPMHLFADLLCFLFVHPDLISKDLEQSQFMVWSIAAP